MRHPPIDDFIRQTREKVTKGTSALFLLSTGAVTDRVVPEMNTFGPELIATNLSTEQEGRLRELFGEKQNGDKSLATESRSRSPVRRSRYSAASNSAQSFRSRSKSSSSSLARVLSYSTAVIS